MAPCFPYIQNAVFAFIYIVSFYLIRLPSDLPSGSVPYHEMLGICIFIGVNVVYSMLLGKDILTESSVSMKTSHLIRYAIMIIAIAFSIASSIMLLLTVLKLQKTFAGGNQQIQLGNHARNFLTNIEIIFISLISFITVMSLYIYYDPDTVYNTMYETLTFIYHHWFAHILRILLPFLCLGVGSALYDKLFTKKGSNGCGDHDDPLINNFKTHFKNTYWLLFGVVGLLVFRFLMETYAFPYIRSKTGWVFINPAVIFIPTWEFIKSLMSGVSTLATPKFNMSGKTAPLSAKIIVGTIVIGTIGFVIASLLK